MPLVEIYVPARYVAKINIEELHDYASAKDMFNTPMGVMQIMVTTAARMYPVEQCYVSIRCKGKPDRTKEKLTEVEEKLKFNSCQIYVFPFKFHQNFNFLTRNSQKIVLGDQKAWCENCGNVWN